MSKELYEFRRISKIANLTAKRRQDVAANRQEKQRDLLWAKRNMKEAPTVLKSQCHEPKKNIRAEMLIKWKAEKLKKLEEEKKNKKPIFKVGIIQRTATGSPLINNKNKKNTLHKNMIRNSNNEKLTGVVTRSRSKANVRIDEQQHEYSKKDNNSIMKTSSVVLQNKFCKIDNGVANRLKTYEFKPPKLIADIPLCLKLTCPTSPKLKKKSNISTLKESKLKLKRSDENYTGCKKSTDKKIKNSGLLKKFENINSLATEPSLENFEANGPNQFLTNLSQVQEQSDIQSKSLNSNKKEEIICKVQSPLNGNDDFKPIYYSPFVTARSGRKSAKKSKLDLSAQIEEEIKKEENEFHCRIFSFRKYIQCETKRLLETCDNWKNIRETIKDIPLDVEGDINSVVGKTKLLTSDKFIQFQTLIDKCENRDPLIQLDDLQGFQDWVSIEVEKIDSDFARLEKIKHDNWVIEEPVLKKTKPQKRKIKKVTGPTGRSNIRAHIEAQREKMKEIKIENLMNCTPNEIPKRHSSLLGDKKTLLESEVKKKKNLNELTPSRMNSGLEILVASQKSKFSSSSKKSIIVTDENLISMEQLETPGRGILRKTASVTKGRSKNRVTFRSSGGSREAKKGLDEKYFRPVVDEEESPMRLILGDLNRKNTPTGRLTRSRAHSMNNY